MPVVDGKSISPDEAIHRGLCPECGAPITPRTALPAHDHWTGRVLSEEGQRRLDLLRRFAADARVSDLHELPVSHREEVASSDWPVKTYLDYVALGLILEAVAALWRGESITRVVPGFVGGAVVLTAHYRWDWLKVQLGKRFEETAISVATDFKWWLAPILLVFLYVGWPLFTANIRHLPSNLTRPALHGDHATSRQSQIREQLALFIGQAEAMQATCEDPRSRVPDVGQWKNQVEQFLTTLGKEYVVRFREGISDAGIGGVDAAHQACWQDLHVREKNLDRFFGDFRSISNGNDNSD